MLLGVTQPANASAATVPALTVTTVQTTADKPLDLSAGAPAKNDAFVQLSNGNVSWVDPTCAQGLGRAVGIATVPWPTIGNATRTDYTCTQLLAMLPSAPAPMPQTADGSPNYSTLASTVQAATPLAAILTVAEHPLGSSQDGWGDLNGSRVWLSGADVTTLAMHGVPVVTVQWAQIAAMPQVPAPATSSMDPGSDNHLGAPHTQGAILLVAPDLLLNQDGWLYEPSGHRQYVDPASLKTLVATTPVRVTAWTEIAALTIEPQPLPITYVNPASVPLQQTGSAPINPSAGGTVTSSDGVILNVPAGVVPAATTGTVTDMSNGAWNVHINVNGWAGALQVTLPTADGVSHQVGGQFIPEGTSPGQTTVTVTSLSLFGNLKKAVQTAICLAEIAPPAIAECIVVKLLAYADKKLVTELIKWVVAKVGNALGLDHCVQEFVVDTISAVVYQDPKMLKAFASDAFSFLKTLNLGSCGATAYSPGSNQAAADAQAAAVALANANAQAAAAAAAQAQANAQASAAAAQANAAAQAAAANAATAAAANAAAVAAAQQAAQHAATRGFHIDDYFLGGTWARTDDGNGVWYRSPNRPSNGAYFLANGLGVGVDCARSAAPYTVYYAGGGQQTWTWWLHVTDGTWIPAAATSEIGYDGPNGLPGC